MSVKGNLNKVKNKAILYEAGYIYAKQLSESVENTNDIRCPQKIDDWFDSFSRQHEKIEKKNRMRKKYRNITKRVAIIFIGIFASLSVFMMGVEAFRIEIFNAIVGNFDKYEEIEFENEIARDNIPDLTTGSYISYLPEGYTLYQVKTNYDHTTILYKSIDDNIIVFSQNVINDSTIMKYDNEIEDRELVDLEDTTGYLDIKDDFVKISWKNDNQIFSIEGLEDVNTMIQMIKSIKFIE